MNFLKKLLNRDDDRAPVRPLYAAIVAEARQPHWYAKGGVADTIDGRFDMVNAILAFVLVRMEALGEPAQAPSTLLTEVFVEDMEAQLREEGIGDVVVGKHIGKMMSALGGRLGAYRHALAGGEPLEDVMRRNLYRDAEVSDAALLHAKDGLLAVQARLNGATLANLLSGQLSA